MDAYEVKLAPVYMESSGTQLGKATLRRFQADLVEHRDGAILLVAPTGSGKTVALLTDPYRGVSLGLYPNNELVCSQVAGLHRFITEYLTMKPAHTGLLDYCTSQEAAPSHPINEYYSEAPLDFFGERKIRSLYVAGMSGAVVRALGEGGKLGALVESIAKKLGRIRHERDKYAVVLGTPDTLFLLSLYIYGSLEDAGKIIDILLKAWHLPLSEIDRSLRELGFTGDRLSRITSVLLPLLDSTIFIDEYHLYGLYEISSLKILVWSLRYIHEWSGRVIFSSATPRRSVAREVADVLGLELRELDAVSQVKERGDSTELVRGPVRLVFTGIDTKAENRLGKLYGSSEKAHLLVNTAEFNDFIEHYRAGDGRGIVILEKVYHAELFAESVARIHGVKPICLYSMASGDYCEEGSGYSDAGRLLIVGTGAKIGQGVEYTRVSFGVVARVSAPDLLQSISRVGRRLADESTVLIPLDESLIQGRGGVRYKLKEKATYMELAEWVEQSAEPYLRDIPEKYRGLYAKAMKIREELLKLVSVAIYYSHTHTYSKAYNSIDRGVLDKLVVLSPVDRLYEVAMFRSTGPAVSYCRGELCPAGREDLGVIVRNFEVESRSGELAVRSGGRGELYVYCGKEGKLAGFVEALRDKVVLIGWDNLRAIFDCYVVDSAGRRLTRLEEELGGSVLLLVPLINRDFAEYIGRTGRGLIVELDNGTRGIALLYI